MFKKSNIKRKIIGLGIGSIIVPTIIILSFVVITGNKMNEVVNTEIYKMGDASITDISTGIYETIDQAVDSTIRQICISTVRNAKEKIQSYYDQFRNGLITEDEAKKQASDFLLSKKIGESGYIYVLSPDGIVLLHPVNNLLGKDLTGHAFIRDQIASKSSGYFEYMWKNPGEAEERAKSLAQEYFEPWGWLISASGYKNELALLAKKEIEPSIRKIVLEKKIGQSGYVYILGAKGDDKGHYVISYQGKRDGENIWNAQDSDGRLFIQSIVGKAVELAGGEVATERYPWKNKGENSARMKIAKITYYEPWDWVIGAGVYEDELNTAAVQLDKGIKSMMSYISMMCLALVVIGGGLCMLLARGIAKPLQRIIEGLESGADQMASASGQVSSASQTLAEGASEQAASLEEASASLEQMSATTTQNAEHASKADTFMKEAIADINNADVSIRDLMGSMDEMSKASRETQNIVKTIDEIAFQTNLLALNAAVEAARAGEMGAGFAVVAEEVRNLATRAADAARDTAGLIEATVKKIEDGSDLLSRTNEAFGKVSESSVKTGELVSMISEASREQAQGIEETSVAVSEVDKVVQQNVANAEENAGAAEEINAQAEQMRGYVMELVSLVEGSSQKRERQKSGKGHFSLRLPNRSTGRDPKEQLGAGDWLSEDNVKLIAEN